MLEVRLLLIWELASLDEKSQGSWRRFICQIHPFFFGKCDPTIKTLGNTGSGTSPASMMNKDNNKGGKNSLRYA